MTDIEIEPTDKDFEECDRLCFKAAREALAGYEPGENKKLILKAFVAARNEANNFREQYRIKHGDSIYLCSFGEYTASIVASALHSLDVSFMEFPPPHTVGGAVLCDFAEIMIFLTAADNFRIAKDADCYLTDGAIDLAASMVGGA